MLGLVLASGCGGKFDCRNETACRQVESAHGIDRHSIQGAQSAAFFVGGTRYDLVHFEYGVGQDCPAGCFYSHYCAFVVEGQERGFWFSFNSREEQLFDPALYCPSESDGTPMTTSHYTCSLPGLDLPIVADRAFRRWVEQPEDVNDEFRWCREGFRIGYHLGHLPRS
jgi:hypothetical protein